jgi:hypothetical protein
MKEFLKKVWIEIKKILTGIINKNYISLLLISFLSLFLFIELVPSILLAGLVTIVKFLYDKYLEPGFFKIIEWLK